MSDQTAFNEVMTMLRERDSLIKKLEAENEKLRAKLGQQEFYIAQQSGTIFDLRRAADQTR